jgi:hypothetical protein
MRWASALNPTRLTLLCSALASMSFVTFAAKAVISASCSSLISLVSRLAGKANAEAKSDAPQSNEVFMNVQGIREQNKLKESSQVGLRFVCMDLAMGIYNSQDGK